MAGLLHLRHLASQPRAASWKRAGGPVARALSTVVPFKYQELFEMGPDTTTPYKKLTSDYVSTIKVRHPVPASIG